MSENATTEISYHFEKPSPITPEDRWIARGIGLVVGTVTGLYTEVGIDMPAVHYDSQLYVARTNASFSYGTATDQQKLQALEAHPVHHIPRAEGLGIIAAEAGLGMALAFPVMAAVKLAIFKRKMKRSNETVKNAMAIVDLDPQFQPKV